MAIAWSGVVMSIQPRVRLLRSFDQRSDTYLGYVVRLAGSVDGEPRMFAIAIGEAAHDRHRVEVGTALSGMGVPVPVTRTETAELYKISKLKVLNRADRAGAPPPWITGCHRFLTCSASAASAASPHARTPRHARVASGGAGCRWRSSSTTGIQPESAIVKRRSATGRCRAGCTRPDPPAKFPVARV